MSSPYVGTVGLSNGAIPLEEAARAGRPAPCEVLARGARYGLHCAMAWSGGCGRLEALVVWLWACGCEVEELVGDDEDIALLV